MADFLDWPSGIVPVHLKILSASSRLAGGLTRANVAYSSPEPGGRFVIEASFNHLKRRDDSRLFGWLLDELDAGTVFRVTIGAHVETVSDGDLAVSPPASIPYFSKGILPRHSDGSGFAFIPTARAVGVALEGSMSMKIDMGNYPAALKHGHLIGHQHQINRVRSVTWSGSVAMVGLRMPLRSDIPDGAIIRLQKQKMLVQADRASVQSFKAMHDYGFLTQPGQISLMEYLT
jgi:hypothetical protein